MVPASAVTGALLGRPASDLFLRVCGTHHDGRVVRLSSAKCTVGSGPRCTLRLRAPGIDPVHCLILRGGERTVVRRWSPNTRLNGRAFQDAPLAPGDRLSIGSLEFEVVTGADATTSEASGTPAAATDAALLSRLGELERENRDLTFALENHRVEWDTQRQQWEEERRAADGALANRWRQLEVLEAELEARRQQTDAPNQAATEDQTAEIDQLRRELDEQRRENEEQVERWRQERQTAETELAARARRLDDDARQLTARHREFEDAQSKLAQQAAELEQLQRQLDAERETWHHTRDENKRQLAEQSRALDERAAELNDRQRELVRQEEELARQWTRLEDSAARRETTTSQSEPEAEPERSSETNELLARLRELQSYQPSHDEPEETGLSEEAAESVDAQQDAAERETQQEFQRQLAERREKPRQGEGEEESIEDYMARLIHRTRGGSEEQQPLSGAAARESKRREALRQVADRETQAAPQKLAPDEFVPRSSAPEQTSSLSAMRELANLSARTAIGKHHKTKSSLEATHKVVMAGVSASLGLVLLFWSNGGLTLIAAAIIGFGFAGYCAWQAVAHTGQARKTTDTNVVGENFTFVAPHERLWAKLRPHVEKLQQKLEAKLASLKKKKNEPKAPQE